MAHPRVIAYHLILTAYGFWLPNDPRGSWSDFVRAWELRKFGPATRTFEKRSHAKDAHDRALRLEAKRHLVRRAVRFTALQARAVARGFADCVAKSGCVVYACTIMHNHAHLVVARHHYSIEMIATQLKGAATRQLTRENLHPFADAVYRDGQIPTPWSRRSWSVFLSNEEAVHRAIQYVGNNPVRERCREQHWSFVQDILSIA